ncbi:MAG: S-layer homology domain-containing protein [Chloroflexota bacterium]|nr:S-layer homology domain-containing protein [Chloroflexota bacterium]
MDFDSRGVRGKRLLVAAALCVLVGLLVLLGKAQTGGQVGQAAQPGLQANRPLGPQSGPAGQVGQPGVSSTQQDATSPGKLVERRAVKHDTSPPLRDMEPVAPAPEAAQRENNEAELPFDPGSTKPVKDPVTQRFFGALTMPGVITQFAGIAAPNSFCNCTPPDTVGDVGPNHYVQAVNTAVQVFNKSGISLYGPVSIQTLFQGHASPCGTTNNGDPIVLYDELAGRWLISQFVSGSPHGQCIAISTSPDPTGSYHRYYYQFADTSILYDYPKFGVWPDGYYMTANRFLGNAYQGPAVMVFERDQMLMGQAARNLEYNPGNYFVSLLPADLDGNTPPPAGAPNYLASASSTQNTLRLWEFHTDWQNTANTSLTGPTNLQVALFDPNLCNGSSNCIPQPGTSVRIDPVGNRLMFRLAYRNFGTHESLVSAHTVDENGADHAGTRWYEVRDPGGSPYVHQQGTYAPDGHHRFMPSMAMDRDGNMAVGYSVSSSSLFPSIRYAGRMAADPPGVLGLGEATLYAGGGSQTGSSRWGDYSAMSVDPVDGCTFWYTNQYYSSNSSSSWKTRIGNFKLPGCGEMIPTPSATGTPPTATPTRTPSATPTQVPASCANYAVQTSTGGIIDASGKALIPGSQCDDCATYITLPFAVNLYHETYTNAFVSSNGVLQFASSDFSYGNDCLPALVFDHAIAAYWDDLYTDGGNQGVFWKVSGQAPNRKYHVEWRAGTYSGPDPINFEVRLREGSSNFEIAYSQVYSNGADASVGVQSTYVGAGTAFTQVSCNTASTAPGTLLRFTLLACPDVPPTSTPTSCPVQFQDVAQDNTFYPYVRCLACKSILGGYPCGTLGEPCNGSDEPYFRPGNNVTRGQLSKIVSESAGFAESVPASRRTFEDVPPDSPFWLWIERLTGRGVMSGYPCGAPGEPCVTPNSLYFRASGNATRGQLTKIVANAAGFDNTPPQGQYTFADVLPNSPFHIYTERLLSSRPNVMGGYPCGGSNEPCDAQSRPYFRPNDTLTRGQTAKIVSNTFYPGCQTP